MILLVISLAPFANKAFHVDDTLFIYSARHITHDPFRPYDFTVNWTGFKEPAWSANRNPPVSSYILSVLIKIFSEREAPLHICYIIFPVICMAALYYLSGSFIKNKALACLFLFISPGFFVSSTNLMSDIPQLAFYLAALAFYIFGFEKNKRIFFVLSGICAGLAILTKYTAVTIIFIFLLYNLIFKKSFRISWLSFAVSLCMLAFWGMWCIYSNKTPHFLTIFSSGCAFFWEKKSPIKALSVNLSEFIVFLSACSLVIVFFGLGTPGRKKSKSLLSWLVIFLISAALTTVTRHAFRSPENKLEYLFVFLFIMLGIMFLRNCLLYLKTHANDTRFLFLFIWFVINSCIAVPNYTIAARFILPVLPPLVLLLIYLAETNNVSHKFFGKGAYAVYMIIFAVTILVAHSDYCFANSYRNFSRVVRQTFPGKRIFFVGHWGFQYYMEKEGFEALDFEKASLRKGDMVIIASSTSGMYSDALVKLMQPYRLYEDKKRGIFTLMYPDKAGFYSGGYGPLPYMPPSGFAEQYQVYEVETSYDGKLPQKNYLL